MTTGRVNDANVLFVTQIKSSKMINLLLLCLWPNDPTIDGVVSKHQHLQHMHLKIIKPQLRSIFAVGLLPSEIL